MKRLVAIALVLAPGAAYAQVPPSWQGSSQPPAPAPAPAQTAAPADEAIPSPPPPVQTVQPVQPSAEGRGEQAPRDATPQKTKSSTSMSLRLDGGYSIHQLFGLGIHGADVGVGFGAHPSESFGIWIAPRFTIGSTPNGLTVWDGSLGAEFEGVVDRFHVGAGPNLFVIGVHRAVEADTIHSFGLGVLLNVRFDVVKDDDFALFLRLAGDADYAFAGGAGFYGATLGAGVSFDFGSSKSK
jgi:hypothetical protein